MATHTKKGADQFPPDEAERRFEAALKGARIAGHKSKESLSPKRKKAPRKKVKK